MSCRFFELDTVLQDECENSELEERKGYTHGHIMICIMEAFFNFLNGNAAYRKLIPECMVLEEVNWPDLLTPFLVFIRPSRDAFLIQ